MGHELTIESNQAPINLSQGETQTQVFILLTKSDKVQLAQIKDFINKTGALCVSGFGKNIDFISSTVFDILFFEMCQKYKTPLPIGEFWTGQMDSFIFCA